MKVPAATVRPGDRVIGKGLVATVGEEPVVGVVWTFVSPSAGYRHGLSVAPTTEVEVTRGNAASVETARMWVEALS